MKKKMLLNVVLVLFLLFINSAGFAQTLVEMTGSVNGSSGGIQGVRIEVFGAGGECSEDWYDSTTTGVAGTYSIMVPLYCSNLVLPYKKFYSFDPAYRIISSGMGPYEDVDFFGSIP